MRRPPCRLSRSRRRGEPISPRATTRNTRPLDAARLSIVVTLTINQHLLCRHHSKATIQRPAENGRPISRVELLLAPKKPQPFFKPVAESAATRLVNKSIKLSAQWTDVQRAISEAVELSISNLAFAVHRLGCISSFASRMRREGIFAFAWPI